MTTNPNEPRPLQAIASGALVSKLLQLRDAKDTVRKEQERQEKLIASQSAVIEAELNARMNADGVDSIKTPDATVYYVSAPRPSCNDWDAFFKFAEVSGRADLLQKRLSKSAIEAYMADNENALPPGVQMTTYRDLRLKKA